MAISEQCPAYEKCGYVKWRHARPDLHMLPLPPDGDCGKEVNKCPRYEYATTNNEKLHNKINDIYHVENAHIHELPITDEESKIAFPLLPNENNRPFRRFSGGAHR